mmetsp:Transcript_12514/g.43791  ORF Transcript_12514/g.43791 Transcript_12514/m.43791 type:complete len:448 (-) Transcript_12514:214-1557(-)
MAATMTAAKIIPEELAPRTFLCSRQQLAKKLFTKEDPLFLHKIFGLFALLSFVYRYGYVAVRFNTLGFTDGKWGDSLTMLGHLGLSASSMIFHVLLRRIMSKPMIIWKEYRAHAIIFTMRCVSVYAFAQLWPVLCPSLVGTTVERVALPVLVLAHHMAADEATRRLGPEDPTQTTVRTDGNSGVWTKRVLRFYSFYQFAALGSHLLPHARLADMGFNTLIAIQSSAFLMTLFRKGLIRYYSHGVWYAGCLVLSLYHMHLAMASEGGAAAAQWFWCKVLAAFALRVKYGWSKYAIWSAFVLVSMPAVEAVLLETVQAVAGFVSVATVIGHLSSLRFTMPHVAMPEMPSMTMPELSMPELSMPQLSMPDMTMSMPDLGISDHLPALQLPSLPSADTVGEWTYASAELLPSSVGGVDISGRMWVAIFIVIATAAAVPARRWKELISVARM